MKNTRLFILFMVMLSTQLSAQNDTKTNLLYEGYDCIVHLVKGGLVGGVASVGSVGLYAPYAVSKLGDLCLKRLFLVTSSASTFGGKSRKQLQKETRFAEFVYHGAKAGSSATVAAILWNRNQSNESSLALAMIECITNAGKNLAMDANDRNAERREVVMRALADSSSDNKRD